MSAQHSLRSAPPLVLTSFALAIVAAIAQLSRWIYGDSGRLGNDNWSNWTAIAWFVSVAVVLAVHRRKGIVALLGAPVALWSFVLAAISLGIFLLGGGYF